MFLVNGAVTAFYENGTITHHGANSVAKEQVPSATLLIQASHTMKTQRGGQKAILADIAHIPHLQRPSKIDVVRPSQAFDHGGKAPFFGATLKAIAEETATGLDDKAVTDAMAFINWAD